MGFYFGHNRLEIVNKYRYLGILFKNNGSLKHAGEHLANRARKAFYSLKSKLPHCDNFSPKTWLKLYENTILPIFTYGSEVWMTDLSINLDKLPFEKVQNMIFKDILGVHGKASNIAVHTELGVYPLCFKSYSLMFKYYKRLCKIECDTDCKNSLLRSAFIIPSPTKLRGDIVTLPFVKILVNTSINILQWILTKLGTYLVLKRIWNPIDFQGQRSRSPGQIFIA